MNEMDVYAALSTVKQLMKEWFESASEREEQNWLGLIEILKKGPLPSPDEYLDELDSLSPTEHKREMERLEKLKVQWPAPQNLVQLIW